MARLIWTLGVPRLSVLRHDEARRFITLVDTLYDSGVRLFWTAETAPDRLFDSLLDSARVAQELSSGVQLAEHTRDGAAHRASELPASTCEPSHPHIHCAHAAHADYVNDGEDEKEFRMLAGQLSSVQELHFAFKRAASRLTEMSSSVYAEAHSKRHHLRSSSNEIVL